LIKKQTLTNHQYRRKNNLQHKQKKPLPQKKQAKKSITGNKYKYWKTPQIIIKKILEKIIKKQAKKSKRQNKQQ